MRANTVLALAGLLIMAAGNQQAGAQEWPIEKVRTFDAAQDEWLGFLDYRPREWLSQVRTGDKQSGETLERVQCVRSAEREVGSLKDRLPVCVGIGTSVRALYRDTEVWLGSQLSQRRLQYDAFELQDDLLIVYRGTVLVDGEDDTRVKPSDSPVTVEVHSRVAFFIDPDRDQRLVYLQKGSLSFDTPSQTYGEPYGRPVPEGMMASLGDTLEVAAPEAFGFQKRWIDNLLDQSFPRKAWWKRPELLVAAALIVATGVVIIASDGDGATTGGIAVPIP